MPLDKKEWLNLEKVAHELRTLCLKTTYDAGSGHIGGGLSAMDLLTALYYKYMKVDPKNPADETRDLFVMSKGHAGIAHASLLAHKGFFDKDELKTFNLTGSKMGIHLDSNKVPGVDASTGSLGHGLSIAVGMGLAFRLDKKDNLVFCMLGDGECNEGAIWEAAMSQSHFNVTNVITMVDRNKCMIDGRTEDVMGLEPMADKWASFGYEVLEFDGHNFKEITDVMDKAIANAKSGKKPYLLLADTIKGEGIDFMADDYKWHYGAIDAGMYKQAQESLDKYYKARIARVEKEA